MLRIEDAISVEWVNCTNGDCRRRRHYVFLCEVCKVRTTRMTKSALKHRRARCGACRKHGVPYEALFHRLLISIRKNNERFEKKVDCSLTFDEFLQFVETKECHYCAAEIAWAAHIPNHHARQQQGITSRYNLDRKDSSIGYHFDNLVVCCKNCNYAKRDWYSYEEWKRIVELLRVLRNGVVWSEA